MSKWTKFWVALVAILGLVSVQKAVDASKWDNHIGMMQADFIGSDGVASGPIYIPDGTLANPGLAFASDPDTGIFLNGPNDMRFVAGGTNPLNITSVVTITYLYIPLGWIFSSGPNPIRIRDDLAVEGEIGKQAKTLITLKEESVTFPGNPGAASVVTVGNIIPDGAFVTNVTTRVTTAATNCTDVDIGIAAIDTDMFADATAIAYATTTTNSDANVAAVWTSITPSTSGAKEITVTANGGNCFDGVWAITVHYIDATAAISD